MPDNDYTILEHRLSRLRQVMCIAAVLAVSALVVLGVLIQPSVGIEGVHVPWHVPKHKLDNANLHLIWSGTGWIHLLLGAVLYIVGPIASLVFIWALCTRKSRYAIWALALAGFLHLFGPVSQIMQPDPPKAMDVQPAAGFAADRNNFHPRDPVSQRYMQAQIAYIQGDKLRARQLSAGLTSDELASPVEGRYRLQFLQGQPLVKSKICLRIGCLSQPAIVTARVVANVVFALSFLFAFVALWLVNVFKRRMERINELRAMARRRTMPA